MGDIIETEFRMKQLSRETDYFTVTRSINTNGVDRLVIKIGDSQFTLTPELSLQLSDVLRDMAEMEMYI